jgi:hypothetical protein
MSSGEPAIERFLRARAGLKLINDAREGTWETSPQAYI